MKEDIYELSDELAQKLTRPLVDIIKFCDAKERPLLFLLYCINLFKPAFTSELSSILGYEYRKVWRILKKLEERRVIEKINLNPEDWVRLEHEDITLYLQKEYFHRHTCKIDGKLPEAYVWSDVVSIDRTNLINLAHNSQYLMSRIEEILMDFVNTLNSKSRSKLTDDVKFLISRMQKVVSILRTEGIIKIDMQENQISVIVPTKKGDYMIRVPVQLSSYI